MAGSNVSLKSTLLAFWRTKWQYLKIRIFSSPPLPSGFPASFENHKICLHNTVLSSCCCCYLSCFALLGQTRALLLLFSCWVVSDSLQPHGLQPARLLCPWDFPNKNTGVGCSFLLQGIFQTQGSNPGLLCCSWIFYQLSYQGTTKNSYKRFKD